MRVLITGANGFLGSHITKQFLLEGHDIYAISLNTTHIDDILPKIKFSKCSTNNIDKIEVEIKKFSPDAVIHCAWDGGNSYLTINDNSQFSNNIPGIVSLLNIIKKYNVPYFIGIGSGAEYGDKSYNILETDKESPISLYGTCKLIAKVYTEHFCNLNQIKWAWIRPFYIYGPGDVPTRLIPRVISLCINRESIKLDDCKSITDYLYINDFVSAITLLLNSKREGVFNICSANPQYIKEVVLKIATITDNINNIEFGAIPNRNNYPSIIVGDNHRAKNILSWNPLVNIDEGLRATVDFYKNI